MLKKVLIAIPPAMLEQIDYIAHEEHRTRSDLMREALRRYIGHFKTVNRATVQTTQHHPEPSENYIPEPQQEQQQTNGYNSSFFTPRI